LQPEAIEDPGLCGEEEAMRLNNVFAAVLAALALSFMVTPRAQAFDWDYRVWGPDPYAWQYSPRGYYPYYGSHYWVPPAQMRYRYRYTYDGPKFEYYPGWGYDVAWNNRAWHARHYGRHHFWHW
jgi:hypothetical protein